VNVFRFLDAVTLCRNVRLVEKSILDLVDSFLCARIGPVLRDKLPLACLSSKRDGRCHRCHYNGTGCVVWTYVPKIKAQTRNPLNRLDDDPRWTGPRYLCPCHDKKIDGREVREICNESTYLFQISRYPLPRMDEPPVRKRACGNSRDAEPSDQQRITREVRACLRAVWQNCRTQRAYKSNQDIVAAHRKNSEWLRAHGLDDLFPAREFLR
jgi:hypothetical protein